MITTKTMFELYDVELALKIQEIDNRLKYVIPLRKKLLIWFKHNSNIRNMLFNKDEYISNKVLPIHLPSNSISKYYNIQLVHFTELNKEYFKLKEQKEEYINLKLNEKVFTSILIKFNNKLTNSIIYDNYDFNHPFLGRLNKVINKRIKPAVDWSLSNKNKQTLLDQGRIPAYKEDRLKAEKEGIDYKGEEWLSYLSPYNYYFKWLYGYAQSIKLFNIKNFQFIPYRGEISPALKLYQYRNTFTEEQLINQYNTLKDAN